MIACNFRPGSVFSTVAHRFGAGGGERVLVGPSAALLG